MANANPGTETEQPGVYPGKTSPEIPGRPKAEPEMPTRHGNPEREIPSVPVSPEREMPRVTPNVPESPGAPHGVPQTDAPPVMT